VELSANIQHLLDDGKIKYVPLTGSYTFKDFDCGNSDLNEFLFKDAKMYLKHLRYTTTLLETEDRIIAYFSLSNDLLTVGYGDKEDLYCSRFRDISKDSRAMYKPLVNLA
jgi:hypothetical protein